VGRQEGITANQIRDLAQFESSSHFSELEKLVLCLAVAITRTPATVPEELFARLRSEFSERALVELSGAIAWENNRAPCNRVFAIKPAEYSKGQFCPLPEN